jgi:NADPH:quinone reductase
MRAVIVEAFGPADVLRVQEVPLPRPSGGEVLIAVRCAGVGFAEVLSRRSGYLSVRPAVRTGMEVAGTVKVGRGVEHLATGDSVCAMTQTGGYAEFAVADASKTFPVPRRSELAGRCCAAVAA